MLPPASRVLPQTQIAPPPNRSRKAAQSVLSQSTAETIFWRHIWQPSMYTLKPPVYIPKHCRRSAIPGQHAICFRKSRILRCGAVRLLFWWLYLHRRLRPGNEAQDCSRATGLSFGVYFQRLLPVFIRALKKASQLSLASLSASTLGVNGTTAACWSSLPGVTASFADPCVGHRNP